MTCTKPSSSVGMPSTTVPLRMKRVSTGTVPGRSSDSPCAVALEPRVGGERIRLAGLEAERRRDLAQRVLQPRGRAPVVGDVAVEVQLGAARGVPEPGRRRCRARRRGRRGCAAGSRRAYFEPGCDFARRLAIGRDERDVARDLHEQLAHPPRRVVGAELDLRGRGVRVEACARGS